MHKKFTPRFFFEDDDGGNATTGTGGDLSSIAAASQSHQDSLHSGESQPPPPEEPILEQKPNFDLLFKDKGDTAPEAEKPTGGHPDAKAAPSTEPAKPEETKTEEPKSEAAPETPVIPEDDKDLDAFTPASKNPQVVKSFKEVNALIKETRTAARKAIEEKKALARQVEELNKTITTSTGKLPEDVAAELEDLRQYRRVMTAENDEGLQKEMAEMVTKSDDELFGFLKQHGLGEDVIADIKAHDDIRKWPNWKGILEAFSDPLNSHQVLRLLEKRDEAVREKGRRMEQFTKDREGYMKELDSRRQENQKSWSETAHKKSLELVAPHKWVFPEEIPPNASQEEKARIEKINAEKIARRDTYTKNLVAAYNRDPEATAEIAFKAIYADYLEPQLRNTEDRLVTSEARVKDLESQIAKIKNAGRLSSTEAPAADTRKPAQTSEGIGGDGADAIRNFFSRR